MPHTPNIPGKALIRPIALLLVISGCATQPKLVSGVRVPLMLFALPLPNILFFLDTEEDLTQMTWTEAFGAMHERLASEYAYTDWKQIDWPALEAVIGPQIADAEAARDRDAYYRALRRYVAAVRDAHVTLTKDETLREEAIGGGFGLTPVPLNDGRLMAHGLAQAGPAAEAGMKPGAEILSWNGKPALVAVDETPVIWADVPPGTAYARRQTQAMLLACAPVGAQAAVSFRNPGDSTTWNVSLTATADGDASLRAEQGAPSPLGEFDAPLTATTLESGYRLIRLYAIAPTLKMPFPERAFREMIAKAVQAQAPGIILDLRGNQGGADHLVAALAGHFHDAPAFYEAVAVYEPRQESFRINASLRLMVEPALPRFSGPVVALVDSNTMGPAEGLAMLLQRLPQGHVFGFGPTRGAAGIGGGNIALPGDLSISYPTGRSLDESGNIQIEADSSGEGGVTPDILVPMDEATAGKLHEERRDVLLEAAQAFLDKLEASTRTEESK
ncbi:MAG: hypothetical protein HYZ00_01900 [Candidatus Hydrogenedentes bacterium]|nr:hypothetical protein [Candidatus Hydrogenedentota bacterium]